MYNHDENVLLIFINVSSFPSDCVTYKINVNIFNGYR